jgi:hypothetical protein
MKKLLLTSMLALGIITANAQIATTPITSNTDLINYLQGYGLTITNMNINAYPGSLAFYSGSSPMAFGSGVIMSTGLVDSTLNGPSSVFLSTYNGGNPDPDLTFLSGNQTFDACVIEFDCVPTYANIAFDFAFGSEEYNEYVGSGFNDVFAILLSGPDTAGGNYVNQNLAVVPGTNIPVTINTINNGGATPSNGPCTNCQYFYDNTTGTSIAMDGFTSGLQGYAAVVPGQSYHFKIAIADASDQIFDSQVMFLTNSFRSMAPVGLKEANMENAVSLFPNPAKGKFVIAAKGITIDKAEVYNIEGKLLNTTFDKTSNTVNTENLSKGVYTVHVYSNTEKVVKKLVIE